MATLDFLERGLLRFLAATQERRFTPTTPCPRRANLLDSGEQLKERSHLKVRTEDSLKLEETF